MNARPSRALMSHIDGDFNWVPQFWIFWVDEWMSGDQYWNWKKENWNWTITHVIQCDHVNGNILLMKNIEAYTNTTSRACRPRCFFANQKKVRLNNFTKCRISWRRLAPRVHLGERAAKLSLVKSCQIQPCWSDFHVVFVSSSASFSCWISMFSWSDPQFCLVRLTIFFGAKSHSCWIKSQLQLDFALSQYLILWVKMQILFIGLLVYILLKSN